MAVVLQKSEPLETTGTDFLQSICRSCRSAKLTESRYSMVLKALTLTSENKLSTYQHTAKWKGTALLMLALRHWYSNHTLCIVSYVEQNENMWQLNCVQLYWMILTETLPGKGQEKKERKSIYIAPFIYYVYLKALRHGSHNFTCKYTMPAFPS